MKKVLICPDKFKGTLSSLDLCSAISSSIPNGMVKDICPLSDGGDGFTICISEILGVPVREVEVQGPYFAPVKALYSLYKD
jgi:glycerate 2-kinase